MKSMNSSIGCDLNSTEGMSSHKRTRKSSPFKHKKRKEATTTNFLMRTRKSSPFKHKKRKEATTTNFLMDSTWEETDDQNSNFRNATLLNSENIREGMLILGCVTEVNSTFLLMSLPGCLFGRVSLNNVSNEFTEYLSDFARNSESEEPSVSSLIEVGMVFPCKIIEITRDLSKKKSLINLSINPSDVNAELKPSSLYSRMVLYVSVVSKEDHGYIVDVGTKCIQGFLPNQGCEDKFQDLKSGAVIPTFVQKIIHSSKTFARIQLSPLDFNEDFPNVSVADIKLHSLLPGAKIQADVIDIQFPFLYLKYLCFDACASILSLGTTYKAISVGSTITGTVLCVHPVTRLIYVMLNLKPSPALFAQYFGLKQFAIVQNLKYQYIYKGFAYYKIAKGTYGFIPVKEFDDKKPESDGKSLINHLIPKACILRFHYMDNLVGLSAKPSLTEKEIIFFEDVQVGDIYDAVVKKHVVDGMIVKICLGLFGFVRRIHMSDIFITKPEILFPVGSKIKCRVLSTNGKDKLNLTCKESLLNLQYPYILSSYESIQKGQFYKGVIVQKTDEYIIVLFFGDVKGIVNSSEVPEGSVFFEGQTVLCEVVYCNPRRKKLHLSLKNEGRLMIHEVDEFMSENFEGSKKKVLTDEEIVTYSQQNCANDLKVKHQFIPEMSMLSSDESEDTSNVSNSNKSVKAIVKSVKRDRLNILMKNAEGRVHITELGCVLEGVYPLREFSRGRKIKVYIVGETKKRKKNHLSITHRNLISVKECALFFPPVSISKDIRPGNSLIGFIKEVHAVSAVLWLSPTQIGVLDYLHFSDSLKVVKRLRRYLKIGLSVKVSVLDNNTPITLTKIEKTLPVPGRNILGLVQIPCAERGLILKLPYGYHGSVAVTDLTDVYIPVQKMFEKYCKNKYLKCHVLEVNHHTKYCHLSLRRSRVYGQKIASSSVNFCPEITEKNIEKGSTVKGFVKSTSDSAVTVILGRNLDGKIQLHSCTSTNCRLCKISKKVIVNHPVGSVVDVTVKEKPVNGVSCILDLTSAETLKTSKNKRLNITEDILWDEV